MLKPGDAVENFTLENDKGEKVNLSDFKGQKVVVYFYPRDDTPGCTAEACSFRDEISQFADINTVILGISKDSVKSHMKFIDKYDLPFQLLSDPETKVIQQFGAWGEKKNYGKTYMGIIRSTFILDEEGKVLYTFDKVKTKDHALTVLEEIKKF
ncbi:MULTISPECIES: thioredoxin-dependent thiol peroxidase [unclassified Oceanispirochaeta]|uniref:thioredoxin-dependent thiol peroxidase n=1 Tax=unclassified Oceanispirochaeta TaxID=2635722 RepID=UPI000E0957D9|nr:MULTISPECIES: thioredoxin-dependent thiol peroxidase [unclassified Oceanispirochaeta]MBF9017814.1 thioredoxin-dependent thiol peroxidase [Oceanispirochaeta sp. M2]NPD74274.1 thioredoxin-dependent thiol peroxidase [Oceanispirochaeta sp. M1]RDG29864.1 thioredoxin-dependent thiol peroxidase [Oceanispirochaeta sp. M1]